MIEKEQIAHDLAVAKLYGSDLQTEDLIKQYRRDCKKSCVYKQKIFLDMN